jgi:imidazolonepropionase-like amidohydrolase
MRWRSASGSSIELAIVRTLHAAGVPFLAGTDTPAGVGVTPGISLHLCYSGSSQQVDAARGVADGDDNPARFFGSCRTTEVCRQDVADLVILRANPLEDIANTRAIGGVVADGTYWSQAEIEGLRERLKQVAAGR